MATVSEVHHDVYSRRRIITIAVAVLGIIGAVSAFALSSRIGAPGGHGGSEPAQPDPAIARDIVHRYGAKVVFVTANPAQIDNPDGALGYIRKPFSEEAIVAAAAAMRPRRLGVSTVPGHSALQRRPRPTKSAAMALVSPITAALVAP